MKRKYLIYKFQKWKLKGQHYYYLALTKTHFEVNLAFSLCGWYITGGVATRTGRTKCVDPGIDFHVWIRPYCAAGNYLHCNAAVDYEGYHHRLHRREGNCQVLLGFLRSLISMCRSHERAPPFSLLQRYKGPLYHYTYHELCTKDEEVINKRNTTLLFLAP